MRASELIKKYTMEQHPENGIFIEQHYESNKPGRADSGSIYYYVSPGEITEFHRIDCDEYWIYNAGAPLEVWSIKDGQIKKMICGVTEGAEPVLFLQRGEIFASRLPKDSDDGSFITCITVPRFSYDGFEMFTKEQIIDMYPEVEEFFRRIRHGY